MSAKSPISRIIFAVSILLFLCSMIPADDQGWLNNSLSLKMNSALRLKFTQEARHNELTFTDAYHGNWSSGIIWSISPKFTLGLVYLRETTIKSSGNIYENRFVLEGGWKSSISKKLNFDIRARGEMRVFEEDLTEDHLRLRLRLRLTASLPLGALTVRPFLAVEPFFHTGKGVFNSKRIYLGSIVPLSRQVDWIVSYIRQDNKGRETVHIANTGLDIKL